MKTLTRSTLTLTAILFVASAAIAEDIPLPPLPIPAARPVRAPKPVVPPSKPRAPTQAPVAAPNVIRPPLPIPKPVAQPAPASGDLRAQATAAGQPCLYGGNLSTYVYYEAKGRTFCAPVRSVSLGGKKYSCSSPGTAICNPMLYGVGDGGPLCVPQGNGALKNCAAQGDAKKAAKFVVDNKLQSAAKNSASAIQKNVCGGGAVENPLVAERRRVFSVSCPQVTAQQASLNREIASLGPTAGGAPAPKPQAAAPKPTVAPPPPMPAAMAPPPAMPQAQTAPATGAPPPVPQPPKDPNVPAPPNVPRTGQLPPDEVPKKMEAGCENCETEVPSTASKPVQQTVQERKKILQQVCSQFKTTAKVHDDFPAANISVGLSSLLSFASGGEAQARADAKKPVTALVEQAHAVLLKEKEVKTGCPDGCSRVNEPELVMDNKPKARAKPVEGCPATVVNAFQKPAGSGGRGDKPVTNQEVRAYDKQASLSGGIISKSFKGKGGECAKANEAWAEGLLAKDSKLGEWAEEELCPGQCSFSSLVTTVDRSSGNSCDLTVRIDLRCGPPKAAREWVSTAKVVAKWRCEAK